MSETRDIYCCGCEVEVPARLTRGKETYPHRKDLSSLPFWKCDACGNCVGCHYKTGNRTRPLGVIPTKDLTAERQRIHWILDPIWKSGRMPRKKIYAELTDRLGREYHTANIRSVEEAREVTLHLQEIAAA